MASTYASGKFAFGFCDRCGQRDRLRALRNLVIKQQKVNIKVCKECYERDHPQLMLGLIPVEVRQALRDPRVDNAQTESRDFQWGWNPVGGIHGYDGIRGYSPLTPNNLVINAVIGTYGVQVS